MKKFNLKIKSKETENISIEKKSAELIFIIDKSGSMSSLESDTVGGFNSVLSKQKKEGSDAFVTTYFFDTVVSKIHDRVDIKDVDELKDSDYCPGGCTALIDAIGMAVDNVNSIHKYLRKEDVPEKAMFVIITDGLENSSREYTSTQVKKTIEKMKKEKGWEFIFIGANIDAVETASHFGIDSDHSVNYISDKLGTRRAYTSVARAVESVFHDELLSPDWKSETELDYNNRK